MDILEREREEGVTPPMPPDAVKRLIGMPIWLHHAKTDSVVKIENSKIVVEAMQEANAEKAEDLVKFTEYDDAPPGTSPHDMSGKIAPGHGVFDLVFRNPEIYTWLLQFRKDMK